MTNFKRTFFVGLSSLALAGFAACGEDDDGNSVEFDAAVGDADADVSYICDPVGDNAEVGGLLNAPVDSDVEVIVKEPQHPGDPGPTGLP